MTRQSLCGAMLLCGWVYTCAQGQQTDSSVSGATDELSARRNVQPGDSPQLGRTPHRNNAVERASVALNWNVSSGANIRWSRPLGTYTHGSPSIANGKVYVGTNNGEGYVKRLPKTVNLGVLLCFRESDGQFLWQYSAEKLSLPGDHDVTRSGLCSTPVVEGDRLWLVNNRGEVVCLDSEGFQDGEDDGDDQGVWSPAFECRASFRALTLKPYYQEFPAEYEVLIRALAETIGFAGRSELTFERMENPGHWRAKLKFQDAELYRIEVTDSLLTLSGQGRFADRQMTVGLDLFEGLDQGGVSPALRALFLKYGYSLSREVVPKILRAGRLWTVTATWEGGPTVIEIEQSWGTLRCRQRPDMARDEADVVWSFDMMKELGVLQRNMANCSPTIWGDVLFVCTSNGIHGKVPRVPAPHAPSFLALDKHTGRVLWTDSSPGANILYGQWSSPAVGVFDGVAQVLSAGGDGWLYSFRADAGKDGKPEFLWKFDGNPKNTVYGQGSNDERSAFIASPVVEGGLVYLSMAVSPMDQRQGRLWCIDPTRQGDVSAELVLDDAGRVIPPRRVEQTESADGKTPRVVSNPNSAVVWTYSDYEADDGSFKTTLSQAISAPAIGGGLLIVADAQGVVHALDARTGVPCWTCQMKKTWGSPLIVGDSVFVGDQFGVMAILSRSDVPSRSIGIPGGAGGRTGPPLKTIRMGQPMYTTPAYANGVLYVATKDRLFAIGAND